MGATAAITIIALEYGEELIELKGRIFQSNGKDVLAQITFISQKKDGTTSIYGPFGKTVDPDRPISASGRILGNT